MAEHKKVEVYCPYCQKRAEHAPDHTVYRRSYGGMVYVCRPCDAFVGCHKQGDHDQPFGSMANRGLRRLRIEAHALLDPLWQHVRKSRNLTKTQARKSAYKWLSKETGIPEEECHIGMMRANEVLLVIKVCKQVYERKGATWQEKQETHTTQ